MKTLLSWLLILFHGRDGFFFFHVILVSPEHLQWNLLIGNHQFQPGRQPRDIGETNVANLKERKASLLQGCVTCSHEAPSMFQPLSGVCILININTQNMLSMSSWSMKSRSRDETCNLDQEIAMNVSELENSKGAIFHIWRSEMPFLSGEQIVRRADGKAMCSQGTVVVKALQLKRPWRI